MQYALVLGLQGVLQATEGAFKMSFQTIHFLLFLPVVVGAYFLLPKAARKGWLLFASYYFYFFAAPKYLPVLLFGTLFTYFAGRCIARGKKQAARRLALATGIVGSLLGLSFFKYSGLFTNFFTSFFAGFGVEYKTAWFTTAAAVGISYYTFTSIGYLIDVYRKDIPPEKNIFTYALFLSFFPSVVSGPISRAGQLIPQLTVGNATYSTQNTANALRLLAVGYFKKLAVADTLAVFVGAVYGTPDNYTGFTLTLAAIGYALQLYFDFSGYSDIAMATAQFLGIKLPQNFNNPYFSTNFSGFWARWHMSLSTWLQDYIFTPLVWSRWPEKLPFIGKLVKKPPVLSSIAVVFLVSGIWHGDTLCFAIWGALQALYRIGEEVLHRTLGKPKKNPPFFSRFGKTALVLVLWVESLVFFAVGTQPKGTPQMALSLLVRQFKGISFAQTGQDVYNAVANGVYPNHLFVVLFILFMVGCLAIALWADWAQCFKLKGKSVVVGMQQMPAPLRWCTYYVLTLGCFVAFLLQNGGFMGVSFMYGGY